MLEITKSEKHYFLDIKNKKFECFRAFNNIEQLEKTLISYKSLINKNEYNKALKLIDSYIIATQIYKALNHLKQQN